MLKEEHKGFSSHDKVKDKINEIVAYYQVFMDDLTRMQTFYTTNDDDQVVGESAYCKRGHGLVEDVERLLRIHTLDEQIVSRETLLADPLPLHDVIASLTADIVRLQKIREEVADECIRSIHLGLIEEMETAVRLALHNAVSKNTPQLELDDKLEDMLEARTKRMPI